MEMFREITQKLYNHKFIRYIVVGGTTFVIDLGLLILLKLHFHLSIPVATTIAYWTSIIFNFTLNRWWSFNIAEKKNLSKHMFSYLLLLSFNYLFTVIFVSLMSKYMSFALAKILAVLLSTPWTYIIYKNIIFKKEEPINTSGDI